MQNKNNPEYLYISELIDIENFLKNYNNFIVGLLIKYFKGMQTVVDFGSGIGTLSHIFKSKTGISPICIELDERLLDFLQKRKFETLQNLEDVNFEIEGIFTSNVLEHIEDDVEILDKIYSKMKKNSKLAIFVPAFMILYSDLDKKVGHYRRYERKEIIEKIQNAGFKINKIHYFDSVGFIVSFFLALALKGGMFTKNEEVEFPTHPVLMKIYDRLMFPLSCFLDLIGFRFLFGKNIYLEAEK